MTWSYVLSQLATSPMMQVRLAFGDTLASQQQLQDEEIEYFLTVRSSINGAAAECCRTLSAQYSRSIDMAVDGARNQYSQLAAAYALRAQQFDAKAAADGAGMPYTGGVSVADKETQQDDPDRVNPQFALGMFDSNLPIGQLAQTATGQTDENS
jgi:hypothetical protein